ncbi:hypothetical protein [Maribacter polysaccharolyticus]|uniref:hypothetical protein n=1 Tax=Maribacter polysaccharolyticus TaxID=3020831 RepID=UPI00237F1728|nr:hypothetical protein [Maribacter polysaccharolyticus]MDE3743853.1 hypothetical protein [Maribacter polysaccharolyticus]
MKTKMSIPTLIILLCLLQTVNAQKLKDKIQNSVVAIGNTFTEIPVERLKALDQIAFTMIKKLHGQNTGQVIFIDNKNREISQLAMIWLQTGLFYYGHGDLFDIQSAGLTPENKTIPSLQALNEYGFNVKDVSKNNQVSYRIKYGSGSWTVTPKSVNQLKNNGNNTLKIYLERANDDKASKNKIALPYSDPTAIAKEMLYMATRMDNLLKKEL